MAVPLSGQLYEFRGSFAIFYGDEYRGSRLGQLRGRGQRSSGGCLKANPNLPCTADLIKPACNKDARFNFSDSSALRLANYFNKSDDVLPFACMFERSFNYPMAGRRGVLGKQVNTPLLAVSFQTANDRLMSNAFGDPRSRGGNGTVFILSRDFSLFAFRFSLLPRGRDRFLLTDRIDFQGAKGLNGQ